MLMFLHGGGLNQAMWVPQIQNLSEDFAISTIDLPGHGELSQIPFTLAEAVEHVKRTISRECNGRVVTIGLSLGGYVAIAHAAKYPDQVAGLVLSGCCVQYFGFVGLLARINVLLLNWLSNTRFTAMQKRMIGAVTDSAICKAVADRGFSRRGAQDGMNEVIGEDFASMLRRCQVPVTIVNGEHDTLNRRNEHKIINAMGNARIEVLKNCGHLCSLECSELFSGIIRQFIIRIAA